MMILIYHSEYHLLCRTYIKLQSGGISLVVQWLRLCGSTAGGTGSIPGQGTKIPPATWCSQK